MLKNISQRVLQRQVALLVWPQLQRVDGITTRPINPYGKGKEQQEKETPEKTWPRKIFSGVQPSGTLHLGNYLGAIRKWTELQNAKDDVTFCIVDLHSITVPQDPVVLRENIYQMAATMLACGIDPEQSTLFVQSAVKEHSELAWILNCFTTMARLGHLPQYKEKTRAMKDIPLGLFVYPVLQSADIMLYKATHVPVGEDQVQHIQLAQHLAKLFNTKHGPTFPICHAMIEEKEAARIRSLRDPNKKMSKSDPDTKATINLMDEPIIIVEKIKKAVTDFQSDVTYHVQRRAGVSNLIAIHALVTGQSIDTIVHEATSIDTGKYKLRVADAVVEHLKPIRQSITTHLGRRSDLIYMLETGAQKARLVAEQTMSEVRQKMGLGAQHIHALVDVKVDIAPRKEKTPNRMTVPKQEMRLEKENRKMETVKPFNISTSQPLLMQQQQLQQQQKQQLQQQQQQSTTTIDDAEIVDEKCDSSAANTDDITESQKVNPEETKETKEIKI